MIEGTVIKSTGSWYHVQTTDEIYQCRVSGKFRLDGLKLTNPVAVGDQVMIELGEDEEVWGTIKKILPRKNYVVRQSPRKKHFVHLLASNVDQAILLVTIVEPLLKQGFIDRFLLMTEPYDIPVTIVFNKSDLYEEKNLDLYNYMKAIYENIGYQVVLCSAIDANGLNNLRKILKDKTSLIAGQSGVGKSTIVNSIDDEIEIDTQKLSDYSGKGQHTTTFAEMHTLSFGGQIIDTPGIKTLGFNHLEEKDIAHNFRELFALSTNCKYNNCMHRQEPHCAVKEALEEGRISELRYSNYLQLLEEVEDQNYWELNTDF